jgi:hypothetical protein
MEPVLQVFNRCDLVSGWMTVRSILLRKTRRLCRAVIDGGIHQA